MGDIRVTEETHQCARRVPYTRGRNARERELKYRDAVVIRFYALGRWQFDEFYNLDLEVVNNFSGDSGTNTELSS